MEIATTGPLAGTIPASAPRIWTGRIITAVSVLFLLLDAGNHLMKTPPVVEAFVRLGVPVGLAGPIGALEIACLVVYLVPRTALLGAILLTGYLGGAVAIQLRAGSPLFAETLFPVYFGALVWVGLLLRRPRLWAVLTAPRRD